MESCCHICWWCMDDTWSSQQELYVQYSQLLHWSSSLLKAPLPERQRWFDKWGTLPGNIQGSGRICCMPHFQKKEEGINITIHWQDADSSSSKAMTEHFPVAEIMICGGHAGKAHKKSNWKSLLKWNLSLINSKRSITKDFHKLIQWSVIVRNGTSLDVVVRSIYWESMK